MALFTKNALVVVEKLKASKTSTVETIVTQLKPYETLIDRDLQSSLLSLMQETPPQEDIVLALLGDLSAELQQAKKRSVSNDDLEIALAIKQAATAVARLQTNPPSATDVLFCLKEHMKMISDEWHAQMHSLVPSTSPEWGSPLKCRRTA